MITDNDVLTRCASKYYNTFKVPTMIVDSSKKRRCYTSADKANLDIFCNNDNIGIIVNLSQELNTLMWDRINRSGDWNGAMKAYYDNCLLSILSEIAIDMTKREYPIDCIEELKLVRAKYDDKDADGKAIRPYFFAHVAKKKGYLNKNKKNYLRQMAPMDYLQIIIDSRTRAGKHNKRDVCTIGELMCDAYKDEQPRKGYVDLVLSMVKEMDYNTRMLYQVKSDITADSELKREMSNMYYEKCINGINKLNLNNATLRELLVEMDNQDNSTIRRKLWTILFSSLGDKLFKMFSGIKSPVYTLEECSDTNEADIYMYDLPFKKKLVS